MRTGRLIIPTQPVPYDAANAAMHGMAEARLHGEGDDALVLLEHPPVFTAGRGTRDADRLWDDDRMAERGAIYRPIDRGGALTFHGPGQLVGYPVLDLGGRPDALRYVRDLEEVVIRAARGIGVEIDRSPVQTGVWAGDRKVCAIGVRLARMRVSLHGFALNCSTDLGWFEGIVACGLPGHGVTSLSDLAGRAVTVAEMTPLVAAAFGEVFGIAFEPVEATWPEAAAAAALQGPPRP